MDKLYLKVNLSVEKEKKIIKNSIILLLNKNLKNKIITIKINNSKKYY